AASTSLRAMSRSPLWLIPISAATYAGCPSPTRRSPIRTVRAMRPPFVSVAQGCSRAAEIWQRGEASTKLIEMRAEDARALVTGGAGFIGSHLVERLVDLGARVTVVDDLSTGRLENLRGVRSRIDLDTRPLGTVLDEPGVVLDCDVIFHLAANAYIPPSVDDPAYDYGLNLETT